MLDNNIEIVIILLIMGIGTSKKQNIAVKEILRLLADGGLSVLEAHDVLFAAAREVNEVMRTVMNERPLKEVI